MDQAISIQISGIEEKDGKVSLLEQSGNQQYPTRYTFFKEWEGKSTDVYDRYRDLGLKVGQVVNIVVREKVGKNQFGKEVTYRNIVDFPSQCDNTPTQAENPAQRNSAPPGAYKKQPPKDFKATMDYKGEQIARMQAGKEEGMRLMSAGRDAAMVVTAMISQGSAWTDDQVKEKIMDWRNWMYKHVYKMSDSDYKNLNSPF